MEELIVYLFVGYTLSHSHRLRVTGANFQPASCFGLEDFQLEPASSEMAANRGRSLWNWNATVVEW
jgi:hypothetical protein